LSTASTQRELIALRQGTGEVLGVGTALGVALVVFAVLNVELGVDAALNVELSVCAEVRRVADVVNVVVPPTPSARSAPPLRSVVCKITLLSDCVECVKRSVAAAPRAKPAAKTIASVT
jgi:hypothetical protein